MQNTAYSFFAGDVIEFRQKSYLEHLEKKDGCGSGEGSLSSLSNSFPSCSWQQDSKITFGKHSRYLVGNIKDKDKMIRVIYLKSECKRKMVGREPLELFPGWYDINSAP